MSKLFALNRLKDDRQLNTINLEVQLRLKQGQVEVKNGDFIPDYTNCVLIHRLAIENLNAKIKVSISPN